jgi:hypothetical protein
MRLRSRNAGLAAGGALLIAALAACTFAAPARRADPTRAHGFTPTPRQAAFLDTLERRTFDWFWEVGDARTGMVPDRWPTRSFVSVGAVGFGLTAYPIGAERGWITRAQAAERTLATLGWFWAGRQDTARAGCMGYRGFFYHFLDPATGRRFEQVELSTMDTALLLGGVLFAQSYFDRPDPRERRIRALADSLYRRVDFAWAVIRPPTIVLAWDPETGHLPYDWRGYNESMLLQILALGSPTHPAAPELWKAWTRDYAWGTFEGQTHLGFEPLFGHQFSHVWLDLAGIQDDVMRGRGMDYFENSRRATLAQRAYAVRNPGGFRAYSDSVWGLSACDGPLNGEVDVHGRTRRFETYSARGASFTRVTDDGTIAPTAAGGSIAFAPEAVVPTLLAMRDTWGDRLFSRYGFVDAFNPTLDVAMKTQHGAVVAGVGWFDTDQLGIDQGLILAMTENWRTGLVWRTLRRNPYVVHGLRRAGFSGGWLDRAPKAW